MSTHLRCVGITRRWTQEQITPTGQNAPVPDKDGNPKEPDKRFTDAAQMYSVLETFKKADKIASDKRTLVTGLIDGNRPYDPKELEDRGQGDRTNLNFRQAETTLEEFTEPLFDLLTSDLNLVMAKVTHPDVDKGTSRFYSDVIAEEFTTMCRAWPGFHQHIILHQQEIGTFGLGPLWHDHTTDWKFRHVKRGSALWAEEAEIGSAPKILYIMDSQQYLDLYAMVRTPEAEKESKTAGWNTDQIKLLILKKTNPKATYGTQVQKYNLQAWEAYQTSIRNNDMGTFQPGETIAVAHCYHEEFDGKITHSIIEADSTPEDYLFQKEGEYGRFDEFWHPICENYGRGTWRSIRGKGQKMYPQHVITNRLMCQLTDLGFITGSIIFSGGETGEIQKMQLVRMGPTSYMPQGVSVEQDLLGARLDGPLTVLNLMHQSLQKNTQTQQPSRQNIRGGDATPLGETRQAQAAGENLRRVGIATYYMQIDFFYNTTFTRTVSGKHVPGDTGERDARDFIKRCEARGVPKEILSPKYVTVKAIRSIGAGSRAQRLSDLTALHSMKGGMPEDGKRNVDRDFIIGLVGPERAERYISLSEQDRLPIQEITLVIMENATMAGGTALPVAPDQEHATHLFSEYGHLREVLRMREEHQKNAENMDLQSMARVAPIFVQHIQFHAQGLAQDPSREDEAAQAMDMLGVLANWIKQVQQQAGEQAEAMAKEQERQAQSQANRAAMEERLRVMEIQQRNMLDFQVNMEKAQREAGRREAMTAHKIALEREEAAARNARKE